MGATPVRNPRLLDRQVELLRHLTGVDLIFGEEKWAVLADDPSLRGISIPHLRLEAEMSHNKRMGKLENALQRTFACLAERRDRVFREFAAACPPESYRRYDEALCFCTFLENYWKSEPPSPPFILDLARLELALARISAFRKADRDGSSIPPQLNDRRPLVRLLPSVEILKMNYDLRCLFEAGRTGEPSERAHYILVAQMKRGVGPRITEISAPLADVLERIRQWAALEEVLEDIGPDQPDARESLRKFLNAGVVEVVQ